MQNSVPEGSSEMSEFTDLQSQQPPGSQNYGATAPTTSSAQFLQTTGKISAKRSYLAVGVLCYINLLNYMDWFIVPGVLVDITKYFNISDSIAGLLQTVFILCFLVSAPIFGYLGDRYNRKVILSAGIVLWSGVTLGSSFITESYSWIFFVSRGFVGFGTASYSTIAPTIIADLFEKDQRTWMLSVFYISIPVGSGLGYVLASSVTQAAGHWHWAFRITPCMGVVAVALLILLVPNPTQDAAEGQGGQSITSTTQGADKKPGAQSTASTTWCDDVKSLSKNRSFIWSSLGVTAMAFVTGALGLWVPLFLDRAQVVHDLVPPCLQEPCKSPNSLIFGGITIATGIVGVITGAAVARRYKKINTKADPLICAVGMFSSAPFLYLSIMLAARSIVATYYVVVPKRQSTAVALQIFVSHLLGDAGSPYLTGVISDALHTRQNDSHLGAFRSLQYSFILCVFIDVLGGGFFLLTALHVEEDRQEAQQLCRGIENKGYISTEDDLQDEA
ncbi:protein spinster homolog 3 isoform X2 [Mauremys reevesii]|uniref:protein spinster homolog 3 isoform X2 n=1 Tax=Mauremys reevesii TaxID=260615 RepID=UPI00193F092F|nr:protein spinster homolog 3 isoform X2 [Mauremys reevesii]